MKNRRQFLCFVVLLAIVGPGFSQNKMVDSLLASLNTARKDTNRVNALILLSEHAGWRAGNYDTAVWFAGHALPLAQKLGYKKGEANAYSNAGVAYQIKGKYSEALENHYAALKIRLEINNKKGAAASYHNIGIIMANQGKYAEAIENHSASLKIREEIGDKAATGLSYNNIGAVHYYQGHFDEALKNYLLAEKIAGETGNKKGLADAHNNIGNVYYQLGNFDESLKNQQASLEIKEEIGDKAGKGDSYQNIGNIYMALDDHPEALKNYKAALKIKEEAGDIIGIGNAHANIGAVHYFEGNYEEARSNFADAMEVQKTTGNKAGMTDMYMSIGNTFSEQSKFEQALENYLAALSLSEETGNSIQKADCYNNIGGVYVNLRNYRKAFSNYYASLALREKMDDKRGVTDSHINIADLYLVSEQTDSVLYHAYASLRMAKELKMPEKVKMASRSLVKAYMRAKQTDSAEVYLSLVKKIADRQFEQNYFSLSEKEKELYFPVLEKNHHLYYEYASMYHSKYPYLTDTAYTIALMNKGLALKSATAMRTAVLNSGDTALIKQYEQWIALKQEITEMFSNGEDTRVSEGKANELEKELVKRSTVFSDFDKVKKLNWKQVQKGLKKGEAAIEFILFPSGSDTSDIVSYAALIVKPGIDHPEMVMLSNESDIRKTLGTFQGNNIDFVNRVYGTAQEAQTALYNQLWKPMEKSLKGVSTIYYSPVGLLHKISFSAISNGKNTFLCDRYNLNRQNSTGKTAFPENIAFSVSDAVALVGGVKYNTDSTQNEMWSYLPGTLKEVEQIDALLKARKVRTNYYVAAEASEGNIKNILPQEQILHIATHGFFFPDPDELREEQKQKSRETKKIDFRGNADYAGWSLMNNRNPLMRSGIVLSGANDIWKKDPTQKGEDGVLTAGEVSNLDLRKTKLAVLSACETGLGDIKGSEGVYGLQRAFKMAGVKNIIMSLWQVPDKETSEFMVEFYKRLVKGESIKNAFNATQKEMRKKYDPYYWAAFVLVE